MTPPSPLGRDSMAFREKMQRYKAGMEFNLYAAEQACAHATTDECDHCPLENPELRGDKCPIIDLRNLLGDHIQQHDLVPPCQCAGDTGKGTVRE